MASTKVFKASFSGGELSPEMFGRVDDAKYANGAASIQNLITTPLGPLEKRPGFQFVAGTRGNTTPRLIPFTYSPTQTMIVELGAGYFRFYTQGAPLLYGATQRAWVVQSAVTFTIASPTVVNWTAHALVTGDQVQFAAPATGDQLPGLNALYPYTVTVLSANTFNITDPATNTLVQVGYPGTGTFYGMKVYAPGELCSYSGTVYYCTSQFADTPGTPTLPAANPGFFYALPSSLVYEVPNAYAAGDLMSIHFVQSNDVITLVHPNYPPMQLQRLGASQWTWVPIVFGQELSPPLGVAVTPSPGYLAQIASITTANPAVITTKAPHLLSFGDAIYIENLNYKINPRAYVPQSVITFSTPVLSPATNINWTAHGLVNGDKVQFAAVGGSLPLISLASGFQPAVPLKPMYSYAVQVVDANTFNIYDPAATFSFLGLPGQLITLRSSGSGTFYGMKVYAPGELCSYSGTVYDCTAQFVGTAGTPANPSTATAYFSISSIVLAMNALDGFYLVNSVPTVTGGALSKTDLTVMDYSGNILSSAAWVSWAGAIGPIGPPYISAPTIQSGSRIFNIDNHYVVTAVDSTGVHQSGISADVHVINNLDVTGSFNTITWNAVLGAHSYYIYKKVNGLYGYIGMASATGDLSFVDNNIAPDMGITPPNYIPVFNSAGNYPSAVSYYQQRRCFGGTATQPQNLWLTKSGTESDMSYSLPIQDTDRVAITIAVREMSTIQHIIPLLQLILLTSAGELSVSPTNTDVITPSTIDPRPQSYIGASPVQPSIVNNSMIYCANRGGHVREMGYQWQIGGYVTGDISLRAGHLFDNLHIVDQAFMKAPWQIVWFVSSNGNLIGLTYIPEEAIGAWHHHVTAGTFLSIACVAEGAEDRLYAVIQRTINGATVNNIERMSTRNYGAVTANAFFVDCGATFNGTNTTFTTMWVTLHVSTDSLNGTYDITSADPFRPFSYPTQSDVGSYLVVTGSDGNEYQLKVLSTSSRTAANALAVTPIPAGVTFPASANWAWARPTISGLTWLEGATVAILADGAVQPQQTVSSGGVLTLPYPAVQVTVGLPYVSQVETLPLVIQMDANGQGRMKNINKVWLRLFQSSAISAGPSPTSLTLYKQRTTENYGQPPNLVTDEVQITIPAGWETSGQVYIQQTDPLPLTLVGLTVEAVIGG